MHAGASVCAAALPVLVRHVRSAHRQTEQAVSALNGHFTKLMHQLQEMSALAIALHEGGQAAFDRIDEEFMRVSQAHADLAREHAGLARKTSALAPKVSALLALSRELGNELATEQIEVIATQLFEVMEEHEKLSDATHEANLSAQTRVDEALAPYGETMSKLSQYGDSMRGDVMECLVQLQFQDRVAQILGHVTSSMTLLTQYLGSRAGSDTAREAEQRFLAEMASGYTTDEQHHNHMNDEER